MTERKNPLEQLPIEDRLIGICKEFGLDGIMTIAIKEHEDGMDAVIISTGEVKSHGGRIALEIFPSIAKHHLDRACEIGQIADLIGSDKVKVVIASVLGGKKKDEPTDPKPAPAVSDAGTSTQTAPAPTEEAKG